MQQNQNNLASVPEQPPIAQSDIQCNVPPPEPEPEPGKENKKYRPNNGNSYSKETMVINQPINANTVNYLCFPTTDPCCCCQCFLCCFSQNSHCHTCQNCCHCQNCGCGCDCLDNLCSGCHGCDCNGCDCNGCDCNGCDLSGCDCNGCDLSGCQIF